jgi:steroid 5-alpha reductase family enzyme
MPESTVSKKYLIQSFGWITLAYLIALAAAIGVMLVLGQNHLLVNTFIADLAATLVIFFFGRIFRNASYYDPYWSLAPMIIAIYWLLFANAQKVISWNQIVELALIMIWGLRLTFNWASQWQGNRHEDWRYVEYRRNSGKLFWVTELFGIELAPTIIVFLGCTSLYLGLTGNQPAFGPIQMTAMTVTIGAIIIEATADAQMKRFVDLKPPPGSINKSGLWNYSRHPNYFGEILFWWGIWLFIPGFGIGRWLALAGPLIVTALFVFISIPLMEKRNLARRPGYAEQVRKVSVLIPWFPKK